MPAAAPSATLPPAKGTLFWPRSTGGTAPHSPARSSVLVARPDAARPQDSTHIGRGSSGPAAPALERAWAQAGTACPHPNHDHRHSEGGTASLPRPEGQGLHAAE